MTKENKKTFTYAVRPSVREKAKRKAAKEGLTVSEKIDHLLNEYVGKKTDRILAVWAIDWTESERGWGQRPDGTSLHLSKADAENMITEDKASKELNSEVPDCYSFPGKPYLKEVSSEIYERVLSKKRTWL